MLRWTCFLILTASCFAQFDPEGAHVDLYFPHLADGGPVKDQWQTSFVFVNPHPSLPANLVLSMFGDDGQPLSLNLSGGFGSVQGFTVPPSGSLTLRSSISFPTTITGYAFAVTDLPLQATVLFRRIENGVPQAEISAAATLPSQQYVSPATRDLGVAVVNIYNSPKSFLITAIDSNGVPAGSSPLNLAPREHLSFTLSDRIPSLPAGFAGSVRIVPSALPADQFLAWTLNVYQGLMASLPPGRLAWPISHIDRIWLVYRKLLAAAPAAVARLGITDVNVNLNAQGVVNLTISPEQTINALGRPGFVQIDLSVSELISDSPSELAFIVGHELGHVAQAQHGATLSIANAEQDADLFAVTLMILAGFDSYGGAGALAKLNLVTGNAGLLAPTFDDLPDPRASFTARLNSMFSILNQACALPAVSGACGAEKIVSHPHLPSSAPF
jgi:Zn-dependent protease with chaperone function